MSKMQRYFEQLVEDIRESARHKDRNVQFNVPTDLLKVPEEYAHLPVVPAQKAYQWFRLSLDMFPPAEKWNQKQLLYMCVILRHLFEHYNIEVELPNHLPYDKVYAYLLKALDTYTSCEQDHPNTITFCEGEAEDCPFGYYCASEGSYCDSWGMGQYWEGYADLKNMEENDEE